MSELMQNHDELRALLARIRRRWFVLTALSAAARASAAAAVPLVLAATVAWVLSPSGLALVSLMGLAITASAVAAAAVLFRMPRRPDDCQVARFVEERTGESE